MEKQEFVQVWSNRVGWLLELIDSLLAALVILAGVVLLASVAIEAGWFPVLALLAALVLTFAGFRYAHRPVSWILGWTLGLILTVVAGFVLGLVATLIYGRNEDAE
jgi:hypothetical protein